MIQEKQERGLVDLWGPEWWMRKQLNVVECHVVGCFVGSSVYCGMEETAFLELKAVAEQSLFHSILE
jgi:hypothetical protein